MPVLTRAARLSQAEDGTPVVPQPQPTAAPQPQPAVVPQPVRRGGRKAGRGRGRGTLQAQARIHEEVDNASFFDDPGYGECLQARNGCLGTISGNGFEAKTNFLIDVYALINSSSVYKLKGTLLVMYLLLILKYLILGYIFKLCFTTGAERCIYVPEDSVYHCDRFKKHFDKPEPKERITLLSTPLAWKDLMRKLVLSYPNLPSMKTMYFVENVGFQVI